jgi:2-(1,2-epoxy-1,2-dihydrophenyl)acetyl-CoA isomerase
MNGCIKAARDGGIATVMLCRPEAFNAFDLDMIDRFARELIALASDDEVRAIVISGEGKAFCAGGDLKWVAAFARGPAAAFHELAGRLHQAVLEIRRARKAVVGAVNGVAAGAGCSLALACDFRVMARSASLRQAYTSNGLCPDGGLTFVLPRLIGLARALEVVAFDAPIPAEHALVLGLATKVVEDGRALEEARSMARELAGRSVNAFGAAKRLLTDSFDSSFETHLEREREALSGCGAHSDGAEGLRAFAEKRKPAFGSR